MFRVLSLYNLSGQAQGSVIQATPCQMLVAPPTQWLAGIYHWWDTKQSNGSYTSAPIRANECTYELSSLNRGLKTQNKYYNVASGSWNLQRTESYGYDANLDYLTSANYGDGISNATPSWTYDAAGNRASDSTNSGTWSYDNLNRMTASPGVSAYANNILGNRTQRGYTGSAGTVAYGWDDLNRMTSLNIGSTNSNSYAYRADGLRVSKTATGSASSQSSTLYRYDGQMGIEDVEKNSSGTIASVSRYALGTRGIDAISRTTSSGTTVAYPLYDAHGNNIGLLSKSGSSWSIADERSYDAWGVVRSGAITGDQKGRYCANLGHKEDDESELVYMRARYYEPATGRFVNEDLAHSGANWYVYVQACPTMFVDPTGRDGDLPSVSVGMTGSAGFATTINNIFVMGYIRAQNLLMYINIQFAAGAGAGRLGIGATLTMLKTKAQEGGFQGILMNFELVDGGRFGPIAQRCLQEITRMGDKGELIKNGDFTQIYWLWGAMGNID